MRMTDIVFWLLLGGLVLYIILKVSGFIQSPPLLEISPFVLIALLIIVIRGEIKKDINEAIEPFKQAADNVTNRLSKLEGSVETILHLSKKEEIK